MIRRGLRAEALVFVLAAILGAGGATAEAEAGDACKARFIACVQQTGNPLECHAVAAACSTEMAPDARSASMLEQVSITQREGRAYARMVIKNTGPKAAPVSVRAWGVSCPDGARETLYFMFNGAMLAPGDSFHSHEVVACFGQSSAMADGSASSLSAPQSVETAAFYCDLDKTLKVEATVQGEALVRYQRSDGISGVHRLSQASGADLFYAACAAVPDPGNQTVRTLRQRADATLVPFMGKIIEALGLSAPEFERRFATTGVRN